MSMHYEGNEATVLLSALVELEDALEIAAEKREEADAEVKRIQRRCERLRRRAGVTNYE